MAIRLDSVVVLCDSICPACQHRCTATTVAALESGTIKVLMPPGWTQEGDKLFGPRCTEERALQKALAAPVPDPTRDPPALQAIREGRLALMREIIRADLEGRPASFPELREHMRNLLVEEGDVPDFVGQIGDLKIKTEVRVRGGYVEISFSNPFRSATKAQDPQQSMSLVLRHENLELVDPPSFVDRKLIDWVQNCLRTMVPGEATSTSEPVLQ